MLLKIIIIFILGVIETFCFTAWTIAANQKKAILSSILMTSYLIMYLKIIDMALKDAQTFAMIVCYAISCGIGNYIRVYLEKRK